MPLKMFQPRERPKSQPAHTIAIAAGKGGVGKSTVAVNLALALKLAGYGVGIMDTDIYGPSMRRMLPEGRMPAQKGEIITPADCQGIKMISMAYFRKEHEAAAVRAPIANGIIHQFIRNVQWGNLDFLLIDFPPGTGDVQLTLSQQANLSGALMVTTPQEVSLMDVRKAVNLFQHVNVPIIGVIENMSYYYHSATQETLHLFGKGGGEKLSREIGAPFLGEVPIDPEICRCGDEGKSIFHLPEEELSPGAKAFQSIAHNVVAHATALKNLSSECMLSFNLKWKDMP